MRGLYQNMKSRKVSIIVPVYKVEKFLKRCVDSILSQTHQNIEVILVDDGSPDSCPEICDYYKKMDKRVKVIHKLNGGLSEARNFGLQVATGEYLLFVDSDDMIHSQLCEIVLNEFIKYEADIVSFNHFVFSSDSYLNLKKISQGEYKETVLQESEIVREYLDPKSKRILAHGVTMRMYKKELFSGLSFDRGRLHEDVFITYKLLDRCKKLVYVDALLYFYYLNQNGICLSYKPKNFIDEYDALNCLEDYFSDRNELRPYVVKFMLIEYKKMINYAYNSFYDNEAKRCLQKVQKWTREHINESNINYIEKQYLLFHILYPQFFWLLKRIKYILKR